ncbi:MAG: RNA polymerase sigma factor, partial [Solirubrobacteraceae bacterium]
MTSTAPTYRGDEAALYASHAAALVGIVIRRVSTSPTNVEDACSYAWMQMLRHQPARETLLAWLATTATREAIRLSRRDRRDSPLGETTDAVHVPTTPIDGRLELLSASEMVSAAQLRAREADLWALSVIGYSYREIAAARQITERTVEH